MKKILSFMLVLALLVLALPALASEGPAGDTTTVDSSAGTPTGDTTVVDSGTTGAPTGDTTTVETPSTPAVTISGGWGTVAFPTTGGTVLGASTDATSTATTTATTTVVDSSAIGTLVCKPMITSYMKLGSVNNSSDVKVLQTLLNKDLGLSLKVNGVFGAETQTAVKAFQKKYSSDIILPWKNAGHIINEGGTGYVYKTTLRKVNLLLCPTATIPMPALK